MRIVRQRTWQGAEPRCIPQETRDEALITTVQNSIIDRRRFRVSFRVTAGERQHLDGAAKRSGLFLSDYVRSVLIDAAPRRKAKRPAVEAVLLAHLLAKLGVISASLHDIAATARRDGAEITASPLVERDLLRNLRALEPCRFALLRALGRKPARP